MAFNILPSKDVFFRTTLFLQSVDRSTLPQDERTCYICTRTYGITDDAAVPPEIAVRMRCGHIIGKDCITKWLDPVTGVGSNICPLDRVELFEKTGYAPPAVFFDFIEHLRQSGDTSSVSLADYLTERSNQVDEAEFHHLLGEPLAANPRSAHSDAANNDEEDDEEHYPVRLHEEGSSPLGAAIKNFFRMFDDAPSHNYTAATNFDIVMAREHATDLESMMNYVRRQLPENYRECPHWWPFVARKRVTDAAIFWSPWTGREVSRERLSSAQLAVYALVLGIELGISYLKGGTTNSRRLFEELVRAAGLRLCVEMDR
ncbi:hypothetical protein LTS18_011325, partial [Coniosporium uncinatum]